jgi:NitT/TauT family transport system permease protein
MIVMVVGVNVLFWRPLTAWSERFRVEDSDLPRPAKPDTGHHPTIPHPACGGPVVGAGRLSDRPGDGALRSRRLSAAASRCAAARATGSSGSQLGVVIGYGAYRAVSYVAEGPGFGEVGHALLLGLVTFARVVVLVVVATVIWVPIGVWIGLNPKVSRLAQPIVQVLASFPANFLFPLFTAVLVATGIGLNVGGILLMALGSQWYILFNVIAGASAIPNDLREAAANLRLPRKLCGAS